MKLNAEIGPGYKYFKYPDISEEVDENGNSLAGEYEGEVIALGKVDFSWRISDNARLTRRGVTIVSAPQNVAVVLCFMKI